MRFVAAGGTDFWRWQPHPEVWLLVVGVLALTWYAVRVVGPKVVEPGRAVFTRSQLAWLGLGVALLWFASDWPMHDIAEEYLFSVHMTQHMVLTYMVAPVFLLATPEWLARLVLGRGLVKRAFFALARPIPASLLFNGLLLLTHWSGVVNASVSNGLLHYGIHAGLVATAFLLWTPVCGPLPELRISYPAQMAYLFVTSIIPTVPAGWLTFAEGAVYSAYDVPERLWGIDVTDDQQFAGLIMKLVGGGFLWLIITVRFFQWAANFSDADRAYQQAGPPTELTWEHVEREFARTEPAPSPTPGSGASPRSSPSPGSLGRPAGPPTGPPGA